jgi:3-deoxy-D-manno-octulosonic-acid transferase
MISTYKKTPINSQRYAFFMRNMFIFVKNTDLQLLYNFGLFLFTFGAKIAALFHPKARLFVRGRRGLFAQLKAVAQANAQVAWFHCASLGEFEQGRTVMEAYRAKHPQHKILLTFFSSSGYEVRKDYAGADFVFYLPIDTPRNARRFIRCVNPAVAVFIKYEFWYNLLRQLQQNEVPTYIVSAIFRPQQVFFKWYGAFFRKMLHTYRILFVQDEQSVTLLKSIGIENVQCVGDTRFDRVLAHTRQPADLPLVDAFANHTPTLVAGSTWPPDEEKLAEAWAAMPAEARLVIAPHEVTEPHVKAIEKLFAAHCPVRYTHLHSAADLQSARVLIIDTIGILLSAYRYGQVAYIGGGFSATGIHNTLEAAAYGLPVLFGPNYAKYAEAHELLAAGAARSVSNLAALNDVLHEWLFNAAAQHTAGRQAAHYVESRSGASNKVIKWL